MIQYTLRRVLLLVPVLIGASLAIFLLLRLLPGDVSDVMLGTEERSVEVQTLIRERLGLDAPLHVQYGRWLWGLVRGDLGESMRTSRSVSAAIAQRFPITLQLSILTLVLATVTAVPLGIVSALRPNGFVDTVARFISLAGMSIPNFLLGTILILVTSVYLRWYTEPFWVNPFVDPLASLKQMALPVLALSARMMAVIMRMTRSSMLEVLFDDFVRTARAKGLGEGTVVVKHALRNAFIPIVTITGLQLGNLLSGTVIIEQVFALPGIGLLFLNSVYQRDYTMVQGTVFFITFMFAIVNLAVDVVYGVVDPRIRYE